MSLYVLLTSPRPEPRATPPRLPTTGDGAESHAGHEPDRPGVAVPSNHRTPQGGGLSGPPLPCPILPDQTLLPDQESNP